MNKKISCYCPTYGRPRIIEEAIYSFLNQTYDNKELVIVNDCIEQTLIFEHPQVKIFNIKNRILNFGIKFNMCVDFCKGEIIMPWDDDDIYLPWKMEVTMKNMKNGLFHTEKAFCEDANNKLTIAKNLFHCNLALEKQKFNDVGCYPELNETSLDWHLISKLRGKYEFSSLDLPDEDLFYIYRWHTNRKHLSQVYPTNTETLQSITENEYKNKKEYETGDIYLNPYWKYDYTKAAQELIKKV